MKRIFKIVGFIFLVVLITLITLAVARRGTREAVYQPPVINNEPPSVSLSVPVDTVFCEDTLATKSGTLCAVKPSKTDARITDVGETTGKIKFRKTGFGYHAVGIPDDLANAKGIWVHFTGSYGKPYNQNAGTFANSVWLDEVMEAGYVVVQLAYDNQYSVNYDLCGVKTDGYNRDNCAGEVREIGQTGQGESPYRSTDAFNTIDYRLEKLLAYLENTQGIDLPGTINPTNVDWGTLHLSGHSQGANQAYYIAKNRLVAGACIIAGGFDTGDTVNPGKINIADWFLKEGNKTPLSAVRAILATTDDSYQLFLTGLTKAIGLPSNQIIIVDKKVYTDEAGTEVKGHPGIIKDPSIKAERAEACFR